MSVLGFFNTNIYLYIIYIHINTCNRTHTYRYTHIHIHIDRSYSQAFVSPDSVHQIMLMLYCGSSNTGAIVRFTATKFEPFIFSVLGFALPIITYIFIDIVLDNCCLSPA